MNNNSSINNTESQQRAMEKLTLFLAQPVNDVDPLSYLITLMGCAGTGKTTLTKQIINKSRKMGKQVLCVAPTHKARKVLNSKINRNTFIRTPTSTVAGLLGKQRKHGYIGTQNYGRETDDKLGMYDLIIIDEISMVTNGDYGEICDLACVYKKKVLFIGDHYQIPHPTQVLKRKTDEQGREYLCKTDNPAFQLDNRIVLTEIIRNTDDNPVRDLLAEIRNKIGTGFKYQEINPRTESIVLKHNKLQQPLGYVLLDNPELFIKLIQSAKSQFKAGQARIIAYTNNAVAQYNQLVRCSLGYQDILYQEDILMGYANVGPNNDLIIENGQDYVVSSLESVSDMTISANGTLFENLVGLMVKLTEICPDSLDSPNTIMINPVRVFMPDLDHEANYQILCELVNLAQLVNRKGSTKDDFKRYVGLKNQLIFMDNIYHYSGHNLSSVDMKQAHPLLLNSTTDLIRERSETNPKRQLITGDLLEKIQGAYPGLLDTRMDDNKQISGTELLIDMFQVLEKDIDYGYSLTAHKSQGSTYRTVFVDEPSFHKLRDSWSIKYKRNVKRDMERDQLKYVAVSRASQLVNILIISE